MLPQTSSQAKFCFVASEPVSRRILSEVTDEQYQSARSAYIRQVYGWVFLFLVAGALFAVLNFGRACIAWPFTPPDQGLDLRPFAVNGPGPWHEFMARNLFGAGYWLYVIGRVMEDSFSLRQKPEVRRLIRVEMLKENQKVADELTEYATTSLRTMQEFESIIQAIRGNLSVSLDEAKCHLENGAPRPFWNALKDVCSFIPMLEEQSMHMRKALSTYSTIANETRNTFPLVRDLEIFVPEFDEETVLIQALWYEAECNIEFAKVGEMMTQTEILAAGFQGIEAIITSNFIGIRAAIEDFKNSTEDCSRQQVEVVKGIRGQFEGACAW